MIALQRSPLQKSGVEKPPSRVFVFRFFGSERLRTR
jgi:hypothetical protein